MNKKKMIFFLRISIMMLLVFSQTNLENINLFATTSDKEIGDNARKSSIVEFYALNNYTLDIIPAIKEDMDEEITKYFIEEERNKGYLLITLVDKDSGNPLSDGVYFVGDIEGKNNWLCYTDVKGQCILANLPIGEYMIIEEGAPEGYTPSQQYFSVIIEEYKTTQIYFNMERDKGNIVITLTDKDSNEPIPDAEYEVRDKDGNIIDIYTTDTEGKIIISNIPTGAYTITEVIVPEGYTVDIAPIISEVKKSKTTQEDFIKERDKGNVVITLTDKDSNEPIPDAEYEVRDKDGNVIGIYKTDIEGKIIISNIPTGAYTITEVIVPEGYTVDTVSTVSEVKKSETAQEDFIKERDKGNLVIILTDKDSNEPIPDAEYEVRDKDGNIIGIYTTDIEGKIIISNIPTGAYAITEVTVPEGYTVDTVLTISEVKKSETTQEDFIKEHAKGSLQVTITDKNSKKPIENVVYELRDENENIIGIYKTDKNGEINISTLLPGQYTLIEGSVPIGYITENYIIQFEIIENETTLILLDYGKIVEVPEILPDTNNTNTPNTLVQTGEGNLLMLSCIIIFFSVLLLLLQKKIKTLFNN